MDNKLLTLDFYALLDKIMREPNYERFEYKGFKCLMRRNMQFGTWCGYVGIPSDHPLFKKKDLDELNLDVHGGITWSDFLEDENDGLYYIGFDCAHYLDVIPFMYMHVPTFTNEGIYRDADYVRQEIRNLVDQIPVSNKQ
jgi:hypothetical protein